MAMVLLLPLLLLQLLGYGDGASMCPTRSIYPPVPLSCSPRAIHHLPLCRICASLTAPSVPHMLLQMQLASSQGAHLLELRIDTISGLQPRTHLPLLLSARILPVIVSCRPKWDGGQYEGDESQRLEALALAVDHGAEYVDIELKVAAKFLPSLNRTDINCKIIVSYHSYQTSLTADDLGILVAEIQSTGADIVKIVATADKITDIAPMFQLVAHSQVPTIFLARGAKGQISRLLCSKFGGFLTYGSLESGLDSAQDETTLVELTEVYRSGRVNRETEVFGIIASPVGHSKGPILHNTAFAEIRFNGIYLPFLVDDLTEFFKVYAEFNFSGFSISLPHKETAVKVCDEVDATAEAIGAVNTIIRRKTDGKLIGFNTDSEAAISAIEDGLAAEQQGTKVNLLQGRLVVVIGSGGAGKAIAFGAKQKGARVVVTDHSYERAKVLADSVGGKALSLELLDEFCPESGMILANASPVGMYPNVNKSPIAKNALRCYCLVFDAVYNPGVTKLLLEAVENGAAVVSGLEMFIRQASAQFKLFTGHHAPEKLMREIIYHSTLVEIH